MSRRPDETARPRGAARGDPTALVDAALARRAALLALSDTDVGRLFNAAADGIDGLVLERFGPALLVQRHEGRLPLAEEVTRGLAERVAERIGATAIYRKTYPRDRARLDPDLQRQHSDPQPWSGAPLPAELLVREHGIAFRVRPYDGYLTGLFLDHRAARQRVRAAARGRRILNAFAYTCGFSVAAALGGAAETTSVDIARKALEWGKTNFTANGVAVDAAQRFIAADVLAYYPRAQRQQRCYDLILLDPPTFARVKGGRDFSLPADLPALLRGALPLLAPGGEIHLSVNRRDTGWGVLEQAVRAAGAAAGRRVRGVEQLALPEDFAGDPDFAKSVRAHFD